jgi:hypothetical protein
VEIGIGQPYDFSIAHITVPTNPSAILDIFQLLSVTNPFLLRRFVITAAINQGQSIPASVVVRSGTGSGGTGTGATITASPASGPAASTTILWGVTGVGTLVRTIAPVEWQLFGSYEFNRKPGGVFCPIGGALCFAVPAAAVAATFAVSIEGELVEFK